MTNKNSNILSSRNAQHNFKELFEKRLKDRNKKKGFCFSYDSPSPTFDHSYIQKLLYNTYYDISKKLFKESTFRMAMDDYKKLKINISSFEQKYKNSSKKKLKPKNYSYKKITYTNLNEIYKDFLRDKKKHIFNKNNIVKSKLKIDNINRNIRKNKVNAAMAKISLGSKKIKSKVDIGQSKNDNHENSYKKLIGTINTSRSKLKLRQKINNTNLFLNLIPKRKSFILDNNTNNAEHLGKFNNKKLIIRTDNIYDVNNNNINNITNDKSIQKQKYINIYNNLNNEEKEKRNDSKQKLKINERPLSYSRNKTKLNYLYNNIINSSNTKNNKSNKRFIKSAVRKRESFKIQNKPLYTSKIEDVLNEYNRIKINNKKTEIQYKESHYLTFREIENIMKTKEDLLIFELQQKFFKKQFPKPIIKKKNKKELFIKKLKDDVEFLDNKDVKKNILVNE